MKYQELGECCESCTLVIASGVYSEYEPQARATQEGIARLGEHGKHLVIGDEIGITKGRCVICLDPSQSDKHEVGYLY